MNDAPFKEPDTRHDEDERLDDRPVAGQPYHFNAHVTATTLGPAQAGAPGNVQFVLSSNLREGNDGPLVFNKSNNGMNKADYYLINFELEDKTGLNLQFHPNPMEALWVAMGDALKAPPCPMSAAYCNDVYAVSVDGMKMTVRNNDPKFQNFTFSLGFIGDPEQSEYRFDPGGQNQNGGVGNR